jgi:surface antigen
MAAWLVVVALLVVTGRLQSRPYADASLGSGLGPGPAPDGYPWADERDPQARDPWGFTKRQCTSYAAWYLNSHGVGVAARTRGPRGVGVFADAAEWDRGAAVAGFVVSRRPIAGSLAQWRGLERSPRPRAGGGDDRTPPSYTDDRRLTAGPHGHVAVVLHVLADGSALVAGYDGRTRQPELARVLAPRYLYIGIRAPPPGRVPIAGSRSPARAGAGPA